MPEPIGTFSGFEVASLGVLTATGVGAAVQSGGVNLAFQVTIASIGTSVTVRFEGSLDGSDYFNLNASGADFTISSNGTTGYVLSAPVRFVRFRLVSFSGGTPSATCLVGAA